jgi:effector-binding domain-containing protein
MKKIIFISGSILLVAIISSFIFIPKILVVSKVIFVESSDRIVYDYLLTNKNKFIWWPKESNSNLTGKDSSSYVFKNTDFSFFNSKLNSSEVTATKGDAKFKGNIYGLFEGKNTAKLVWRLSIENNLNPLKRVLNYFKAIAIKKQITIILEQFGNFAIKVKNIYGLKINRTIVKDTLLLTTVKSLDHYPSVSEIYSTIKKLNEFARSNTAQITNTPMLNVIKTYKGNYNITIALPVNKAVAAKDNYFVNKMFPGNILETEIVGGRKSIDNGFLQMKNYMKDFKLTSPAMPFEMMITDRSIERDTNKWVTKLYYPIF